MKWCQYCGSMNKHNLIHNHLPSTAIWWEHCFYWLVKCLHKTIYESMYPSKLTRTANIRNFQNNADALLLCWLMPICIFKVKHKNIYNHRICAVPKELQTPKHTLQLLIRGSCCNYSHHLEDRQLYQLSRVCCRHVFVVFGELMGICTMGCVNLVVAMDMPQSAMRSQDTAW